MRKIRRRMRHEAEVLLPVSQPLLRQEGWHYDRRFKPDNQNPAAERHQQCPTQHLTSAMVDDPRADAARDGDDEVAQRKFEAVHDFAESRCVSSRPDGLGRHRGAGYVTGQRTPDRLDALRGQPVEIEARRPLDPGRAEPIAYRVADQQRLQ